MAKSVNVVVGLLFNTQGHVLVALRPKHVELGGLWEFPGGKVEDNETLYDALVREFKEEVGVVVQNAEQIDTIDNQLHVWHITQSKGDPHGAEGQVVKWVHLDELPTLQMPKRNQSIVKQLTKS